MKRICFFDLQWRISLGRKEWDSWKYWSGAHDRTERFCFFFFFLWTANLCDRLRKMGPSGGGCRYQKKVQSYPDGNNNGLTLIQEEMFKMANRCLSLKYSIGGWAGQKRFWTKEEGGHQGWNFRLTGLAPQKEKSLKWYQGQEECCVAFRHIYLFPFKN